MTYSIKLFLIASLLTLASCASGYHEYDDLLGGYKETRINANTYIVTYSATKYTSPVMVKRYLYYRCAKLTLDAGYRYFTVVYASGAPATFADPNRDTVSPSMSATIRMYQSPMSDPNASDAASAVTSYAPATYQ